MGQKVVSIKMKSMIKQHGVIDGIHKKYTGKLAQKNNQWYVRYHDTDLGNTLLKYDVIDKVLSVSYDSQQNRKWLFTLDKVTHLPYQLPQGTVLLEIHTKNLEFIEKDNRISIVLNYILRYETNVFGEYQITYTIS